MIMWWQRKQLKPGGRQKWGKAVFTYSYLYAYKMRRKWRAASKLFYGLEMFSYNKKTNSEDVMLLHKEEVLQFKSLPQEEVNFDISK